MKNIDKNQEKNRLHYERVYQNFPVGNILYWINHLDGFLYNSITHETSWFAMYQHDLKNKLNNKKVLEMGCGNCINAAVMAALGAQVYANDIASASGRIIKKLNESYNFKYPIKFIEGDFLNNNLSSESFDLIVGKAFLHHLTIPVEKSFLKETARLLKSEGEARFFEPAVNSKILDEIRWHIPVKGRPSKFRKKAFSLWKENDPHPDRSFSSAHFKEAGKQFFEYVEIIPVGTLERFNKIFKGHNFKNRYKRWALKNEKLIPHFLNYYLTKSQLIIYRKPKSGHEHYS